MGTKEENLAEMEHLLMGSDDTKGEVIEEKKEEEEVETEKVEPKDANKDKNEVVKDKLKEDKKPENVLSSKQTDILKQSAVLEKEIEDLEKVSVNEDEFYEKLDDILTDEEAYLKETDEAAYLKLVAQKRDKWIEENSNSKVINDKKEQLRTLEIQNAVETGIQEVTKIYPEYNHEQMSEFSKKELTLKEQEEINNKAENFFDVFKLVHEKYLEKSGKPNPTIKTTPPPPTPKTDDIKQENLKAGDIEEINSADEKYKNAMGF